MANIYRYISIYINFGGGRRGVLDLPYISRLLFIIIGILEEHDLQSNSTSFSSNNFFPKVNNKKVGEGGP